MRRGLLAIACLMLGSCVPVRYWDPAASSEDVSAATSAPGEPTPVPAATFPAGPSSPPPTSVSTPIDGELRLAVREDTKTLNPYLVSSASERFIVSLLYDTLMDSGSQGDLHRNLAERWELATNGLELTLWLNPDARWHDGQPVTAQDVVFSFEFVRQWQIPGLAPIAALVDRVEAINLHEVKLALIAPRSDAVRLLTTQVPILPAAVWQGVDRPLRVSNLENPIGSGPFRLVAFLTGERVILQNTGNHHSLRPSVQSVVVEIVRDEDRALEMLQNAELDGIGWSIEPHLVRRVLDDPERYAGIRVAQAPGLAMQTLLLNLRKTPYDDPAFRRAIALAISAGDMVETVLLGLGDAASAGLFLGTSPWRNASVAPLAYDPDEAERVLEAAGFRDRDGDGLRENSDGSGLQAPVACIDLPVPLQIAELVAGYLKAIGIDGRVDPVAQDDWMPTLMQAKFGIALHTIAMTGSEMALLYFQSSHGALNDEHVSGQNYGGYASPQFDEVAAAAFAEPEPTAQWELAGQIQEILATDLPQIALYTPRVLSLFRSDRFTGWRTVPGHGMLHRATVSSLTPVTGD